MNLIIDDINVVLQRHDVSEMAGCLFVNNIAAPFICEPPGSFTLLIEKEKCNQMYNVILNVVESTGGQWIKK